MFCQKCGSTIPEGDRFCPTCGEPIPYAGMISENDHSALFTEEDKEKNNYLAALCYISIFFIAVALLAEPNSKFIRYHANQSINLIVLALVVTLVAMIPILGWIVTGIAGIALVVFVIMGIVNAVKKRAKDLPFCGKYTFIHYN